MTHYTPFYRRNESHAMDGRLWNRLPIILSYIFNLKNSIMTSKGVQLRVQYTAGQLSRDTHHIKVKAIPHKSEHITKTKKKQKKKQFNKRLSK